MNSEPKNIEERLVPFVEGVLNARETAEVKEALENNPALAKEVEELRQIISELRTGFASGMEVSQEPLSPEQVVELASHKGGLESMSGSPELKSKLFLSEQSLHEYQLLRALSEDMKQTTWEWDGAPEMPAALKDEFRAIKREEKVVRPTFWSRATSLLDRVNPKPLMAAAAALAMFSLGIHLYDGPQVRSGAEPKMVGFADSEAAAPEPAATPTSSRLKNEPSGVAVFTSGDKDLLKEQAQKLLAKKIRYTATEDRILVAENQVDEAREVLWGSEDEATVAVAEERQSRERISTDSPFEKPPRLTPKSAATARAIPRSAPARPGDGESFTKIYDNRSNQPVQDRVELEEETESTAPARPESTVASAESSGTDEPSEPEPTPEWNYQDDVELGGNSALKRSRPKASAAPVKESPAPVASAPEEKKMEEIPAYTGSRREEMLRDLALGKSKSEAQETPEIPPAPVPNVITAEDYDIKPGTAVASRTRGGGLTQKPTVEVQEVIPPAQAEADDDGGDATLRVAAIRRSQAEVARRYNVVISVENRGDQITVYIRPKQELNKKETEDLRQAVRADLGLAPADSVVFR